VAMTPKTIERYRAEDNKRNDERHHRIDEEQRQRRRVGPAAIEEAAFLTAFIDIVDGWFNAHLAVALRFQAAEETNNDGWDEQDDAGDQREGGGDDFGHAGLFGARGQAWPGVE
jgi:hypothetical protein